MAAHSEIFLNFNTPEGAVLMWDRAIVSKNIGDIAEVMNFEKETEYVSESSLADDLTKDLNFIKNSGKKFLEHEFAIKGFDIFARSDVQFTDKRPHLLLNVDAKDPEKFLQIERMAAMSNGASCLETFIVGNSINGWRVLERSNLEIHWDHPDLGPLEFDNYLWRCAKQLPCVDREVLFYFDADERGPTEAQIKMLVKIMDHKENIWLSISEYLFPIYNRDICGSFTFYDEVDNDYSQQITPKINTPEELIKLLRPPISLTIADVASNNEDVDFEFRVACAWDLENGISFRFLNWQIDTDQSLS